MRVKAFYVFVLAIALSSVAFAQGQGIPDPGPGNVTVFSEDGDKFTLYINGDQKNTAPAARVSVDNMTEVMLSFRIVFENTASGELKKKALRQGTACSFVINKNKKGEFRMQPRGCSGVPAQAAPTAAAAPTGSSGPLSATYSDGMITISDGRFLTVTKSKSSGLTYPRVKMTALNGAHVTISYDDNSEKYSSEVPFEYEVKDYSNNNSYLTLTVDEGGPDKTWHVKLQNGTGYDMTIE